MSVDFNALVGVFGLCVHELKTCERRNGDQFVLFAQKPALSTKLQTTSVLATCSCTSKAIKLVETVVVVVVAAEEDDSNAPLVVSSVSPWAVRRIRRFFCAVRSAAIASRRDGAVFSRTHSKRHSNLVKNLRQLQSLPHRGGSPGPPGAADSRRSARLS